MKALFYSFIFFMASSTAFAQSDSAKPAFINFPAIPAFTLLKVDSTNMTRMDLPKNKKTLIMFFSPTCDHCRHQTDSVLANMDKFKDIEILMATYQPFDEMKSFYKEYRLANYPNIMVGRDIKYFFPPFYKIMSLPFLILYNEKGRLITTFEGTTKIEKVVEAFKVKSI